MTRGGRVTDAIPHERVVLGNFLEDQAMEIAGGARADRETAQSVAGMLEPDSAIREATICPIEAAPEGAAAVHCDVVPARQQLWLQQPALRTTTRESSEVALWQ